MVRDFREGPGYTASMSQIHQYPVTVSWNRGRDGSGSARCGNTGQNFPLSVGTEYGGTGEGTNPEELLTSAIASCYAITLGIIAANRKLPVVSMTTEAVGEVGQNGVQFTYTAITLKPRIVLESGATDEQVAQARDMAHKAELYCIVTNAVKEKVEVKLEAEVVRG